MLLLLLGAAEMAAPLGRCVEWLSARWRSHTLGISLLHPFSGHRAAQVTLPP